MENPIYIVLSKQKSASTRLDTAANNLANANTPGFQRSGVMFREYMNKTDAEYKYFGDRKMASVQDIGLARDTRHGPMMKSGNKFDLAVTGNGYFVVETPFGEKYTRNGQFTLNAEGDLVTSKGYAVRAEGGGRINLPIEATNVEVTPDGTVKFEVFGQSDTANYTDATGIQAPKLVAGKIDIAAFENEQNLKGFEGSLLSVEDGIERIPPTEANIQQGMLEQSNVKPITELVTIIETTRSFSRGQKFMESEHDRMRRMMQLLGRQS